MTTDTSWKNLRLAADLYDRALEERKAVVNMLRPTDQGGATDSNWFADYADSLEATVKLARKHMRKTFRNDAPAELQEWVKTTEGLGEPGITRLLGHIGDPYVATPHWWEGTGANRILMEGPSYVRTVSQLWQFAGHGRPGRPTRGMSAEELAALGSPTLKMLVHVVAEACMKTGGPYRVVYDEAKAKAATKVHTVPCVRCGPSGKPAAEGTPWNPGHQHAHALRIVGKELLRDMWLARHRAETSQQPIDEPGARGAAAVGFIENDPQPTCEAPPTATPAAGRSEHEAAA